jgi:hypothetical protein
MNTAQKLQNDWMIASQSYFTFLEDGYSDQESTEFMMELCGKCDEDLKENGVNYLKDLSQCTCCERHQMNRPSCIEDKKTYVSNGLSNNCDCACRHFSRIIVDLMIENK